MILYSAVPPGAMPPTEVHVTPNRVVPFDALLSQHQRHLVAAVYSRLPPCSVHVHYGMDLSQLPALGVTIPRKGRRPDAPLVAAWRAIPDRDGFLIVVGQTELRSDAALLTTLGHEVEHVRQEVGCPGILKLSETCEAFVRDTPALHATIRNALHVPVNAHAEVAGALVAIARLGLEPVRRFYENERPDLLGVVRGVVDGTATGPGDAPQDLARFLEQHFKDLVRWAEGVLRPRLASIDDVKKFIAAPCSTTAPGPSLQ